MKKIPKCPCFCILPLEFGVDIDMHNSEDLCSNQNKYPKEMSGNSRWQKMVHFAPSHRYQVHVFIINSAEIISKSENPPSAERPIRSAVETCCNSAELAWDWKKRKNFIANFDYKIWVEIRNLCMKNYRIGSTVYGGWNLTHCGLVTPYGDIYLGQHWFR